MTREDLDNMSEKEIEELAYEHSFSVEDARKGYATFTSDYMDGALHIERIDVLDVYRSDKEAAEQAEIDGVELIKDLPIDPVDDDFAYFIDTPENREIIRNHLLSRGIKW